MYLLKDGISKSVVTSHAYYRERCDVLRQIFEFSRENQSSESYIEIQKLLLLALLRFQKEKADCKLDNDLVGVAVTSRLIHVTKQIADSLAWRALSFDRVSLQILSEHHRTGSLDETAQKDFTIAKEISDNEDAIVLINDLNNITRFGDLTIVRDGHVLFKENKHGQGSAKSGRATRQRQSLESLLEFLATGEKLTRLGRAIICDAKGAARGYHSEASQIILQAKRNGYHCEILSDCIAIEAVDTQSDNPAFPKVRPFAGVEETLRLCNLTFFEKPVTGAVAPYGIFPFEDSQCFDLMRGDTLLAVTLHLGHLKKRYERAGLALRLPQSSTEIADQYLNGSMADKRRMRDSPRNKFLIYNGHLTCSMTAHHLSRMLLDLLDEETIINTDFQRLSFLLSYSSEKTVEIYSTYGDESRIWR